MVLSRNSHTNPLTGRDYTSGGVVFQRNSNAQVPNPSRFNFDYVDDGLHTPNQNIPMPVGNQENSRKSIKNNEWTSFGWENIARGFLGGNSTGTWNSQDQSYFDLSHPMEMSLGFSRSDIEYTKLCQIKDREILKNLNDRQKRLIAALNQGKFFKLSELKIEKN